jgi:hypothetical protein
LRPADSNVTVVLATPLESRATGLPRSVPLTSNCTDPVGVAVPPAGATVAVKVTGWPAAEGLGDAVSVDKVTTVLLVVAAVPASILARSARRTVDGATRTPREKTEKEPGTYYAPRLPTTPVKNLRHLAQSFA